MNEDISASVRKKVSRSMDPLHEGNLTALEDEVFRLRRLNTRRSILAIFSLGLTLLTFAEFILAFPVLGRGLVVAFVGLPYLSLGTGFMALLVLAFLERQNKEAEAVFQELSDQLHRFSGVEISSEADAFMITARFAIRRFFEAGTLPFLSGRSGIRFYALFNILLIMSTFVVVSFAYWS